MKELRELVNQADRPSLLDVARLHSGELEGEGAEEVARRLAAHPRASAFLEELEAARGAVPPFDAEVIRKAAWRMEHDAAPRPQRRRRWAPWAGTMTLIAAAAAAILITVGEPPVDGHRTKGDGAISFMLLRDGEISAGEPGAPHRQGDRIQLSLRPARAGTLVLVSVDGRGVVKVHEPPEGDIPAAVTPGAEAAPAASLELDDAPDYELFLAFFGADSVGDVVGRVEDVRSRSGLDGLLKLARAPDVTELLLTKEPAGRE